MSNDLLKEADNIVKKTYEDENLINEALSITEGMYQDYIKELKELWDQSESDLFYTLMQLKSVKKKLDSLGENSKILAETDQIDEKINEILQQLFSMLPDKVSPDVLALEDIYENGNEPYMYGKSH